jgi:hypothetical protein
MRAPFVILALVATPFITEVSAAQGKSAAGKAHKKDECSMPGLRKGHEVLFWIAKHLDKDCAAPAPTPDPVPAPTPAPTPSPTPDPVVVPPTDTPTTPAPQPGATNTTITGTVYLDSDYSAMPNPGEPRLAGWTVQLLSNGVVVQSTTTDADGVYNFASLPAGDYLICGPSKTGYVSLPGPKQELSCPDGQMGYSVTASMESSSAWEGLNFGYYIP